MVPPWQLRFLGRCKGQGPEHCAVHRLNTSLPWLLLCVHCGGVSQKSPAGSVPISQLKISNSDRSAGLCPPATW